MRCGGETPLSAWAIFTKDVRAEVRNRAAFSAILLFAITSLVVVAFAVRIGVLSPSVKAALLWVVLFFAAFSGLAHVFVHEEDASTSIALRLTASPLAVYYGKLLFNLALLAAIALIAVPLFMIMLGISPERPALFLALLITG